MQQRLSSGKGNAAIGTPVGKIAHQNLHQIVNRQKPNALLQRVCRADFAAFNGLALVADCPINTRFALIVKFQRAIGTGIPAGGAALIPLAAAFREKQVLLHRPAFGVRAPSALKGAANEEHVGAAPGAIMNGVALNIKNHSCCILWHGITPFR